MKIQAAAEEDARLEVLRIAAAEKAERLSALDTSNNGSRHPIHK